MDFHENHMHYHRKHPFLFVKFIIAAIVGICVASVLSLIFGGILQLLWNHTLTPIFSITTITYWQAVGLLILSKLLFSCLPTHHPHPHHLKDHHLHRFHRFASACRGDSEAQKMYHEFWHEKGEKLMKEFMEAKMKHDHDKNSDKE